jgi:hypothetical protein
MTGLMIDVLARIAAYKREDVAARKAAQSQSEIESSAMIAGMPRGFRHASKARRPRPPGPDRRDQEGQPVQGPDPRRLRPAGPGQGL